jgi:protein gp37
MADSKIEWTGKTWNPVVGCSPKSPGCLNCYAARDALRLAGNPNPKIHQIYGGLAKKTADGRPVFSGEVRTVPERLDQPLRWRKPSQVFVNSMSDLFHPTVPFEFIDQVFAVMALCLQHTFQILTKSPERMREYMSAGSDLWAGRWCRPMALMVGESEPTVFPLPNVWLLTSVENQATADERIPHLLATPAAVRGLSMEPLLGPVDLDYWLNPWRCISCGWTGWPEDTDPSEDGSDCACPKCGAEATWAEREWYEGLGSRSLDWVIVGGESGPGARPCNVQWIRDIVRQCREAGVPVFVKQLGASPYEFCPAERGGVTDTNTETELSLLFGGEPEPWEDPKARGMSRMREQQKLSPSPGWCFTVCPDPGDTGWYFHHKLRSRKGGDMDEWPEDLRVREYPATEGGPGR